MGVAVATFDLPGLPLAHRGKVRDTYDLGDWLLIVATDRLSAFDVVLPTAIPGKGIILTALSEFWFVQTAGLMPNHLISTDPASFPEEAQRQADRLAGRSMLVRRAERIDVECVVRGYLAGSAWKEYQATGRVGGESMPAGLRIGDHLPEPIFTPAAKVDDGHDVNLSRLDLATMYGSELAERLELMSLHLYQAASELADERQLILADTKFEFGFVDGELTLIDELLTPDSSRYWDPAECQPGRTARASTSNSCVTGWRRAAGISTARRRSCRPWSLPVPRRGTSKRSAAYTGRTDAR